MKLDGSFMSWKRRICELGWSPEAGGVPRERWGCTYDPHAIEGHLSVELRYHVLPPVKGLRVGEIREGGVSRPNLNKRPEERTNTTDPVPKACQASGLEQSSSLNRSQ